ncbi:MAG: polysaccharide deacetylase family protein [Chthoniobacterales bacterium]
MDAAATSFSPMFAAAAAARKGPAVVSLHDVSPATQRVSKQIVDELRVLGIDVSSLLVVPDYHHRGKSMDDPGFVRWLRDLEADGHEIVIHGYFHQRPRRAAETFATQLTTQFYTQDEGEFYDLEYAEAFSRIRRAREEFAAAGMRPRGFIAPAWLLGQEAERAVADAEFEYTTRLRMILDLRTGENFAARSLVYSVRSSWRRATSRALNALLSQQVDTAPLMRLSIHPPDFAHAEIWSQIRRIAARIAEKRTLTTYQDWIAARRAEAVEGS